MQRLAVGHLNHAEGLLNAKGRHFSCINSDKAKQRYAALTTEVSAAEASAANVDLHTLELLEGFQYKNGDAVVTESQSMVTAPCCDA